MKNIFGLLLAILFSATIVAQTSSASQSLVLSHVTIIDTTGSQPKPDMIVVVTGNRITVVGQDGKISVPQNAQVILDAMHRAGIAHTKRIHAVILNGRFLPREVLQRMLAAVEAAANK